jgi:uncharacterized protein YqgC (DUF456 family)
MATWASLSLLILALLASLLIVPLGLPGLWIMLGAGLLYNVAVPAGGIGVWTLVGCGALVLVSEALDVTLGARYARKYGGSKRASWGSIAGGMTGAVVGVPVPVVGSVIGAFVGAFIGALAAELTVPPAQRGNAARVATGAVVGRAVAAAAKTGIGVVIVVWMVAVVLLSP